MFHFVISSIVNVIFCFFKVRSTSGHENDDLHQVTCLQNTEIAKTIQHKEIGGAIYSVRPERCVSLVFFCFYNKIGRVKLGYSG